MSEQPKLITLPAQPILSVRRSISVKRLGSTQGECFALLQMQLEAQQLTCAGAPFVRYHRFDTHSAEVEIGVPVTTQGCSVGEVHASVRPAGPALTLWHLGPHDATFGNCYRELQHWLRDHEREAAGPGWEVYEWIALPLYRSSQEFPPPAKWRTQLVQPLKP